MARSIYNLGKKITAPGAPVGQLVHFCGEDFDGFCYNRVSVSVSVYSKKS